MVQNKDLTKTVRRGRPRAYDPEVAIGRATDAFWKSGYAATSLDDIVAATGMNRPSLSAAFGDKHALYLKAFAVYWDRKLAAMRAAIAAGGPLREALVRVYDAALAVYFSGDDAPRGCFVVGTAIPEAVGDPEIRGATAAVFAAIDAEYAGLFRSAQAAGEIDAEADIATLAVLATAAMHSLALRARAGGERAELTALAGRLAAQICR